MLTFWELDEPSSGVKDHDHVPLVVPVLLTDPTLAVMVVLNGIDKGLKYVPLLAAKLPSSTVTVELLAFTAADAGDVSSTRLTAAITSERISLLALLPTFEVVVGAIIFSPFLFVARPLRRLR
jgi:hypothetical protein